jgi:hypothetical protein
MGEDLFCVSAVSRRPRSSVMLLNGHGMAPRPCPHIIWMMLEATFSLSPDALAAAGRRGAST